MTKGDQKDRVLREAGKLNACEGLLALLASCVWYGLP